MNAYRLGQQPHLFPAAATQVDNNNDSSISLPQGVLQPTSVLQRPLRAI